MNEELVIQVDRIFAELEHARLGDIATLAELLDHVENLRQYAEVHQLTELIPPTEGFGSLIKQIIMGDTADPDAALELIRKSVAVLKKEVGKGKLPPLSKYPKTLRGILEGGAASEAHAGGEEKKNAADDTDSASVEPSAEDAVEEINTPLLEVFGDEAGAFAADKELLGEYLTEQESRLEEIEGYLLGLEKEINEADLSGLRRALHTIKGDSGFLGLSEIAQISHAAEDYLELAAPSYDLEPLFAVKDWLSRGFKDLVEQEALTPTTRASLKKILVQLGEVKETPPKKAAPATTPLPPPPPAPTMDAEGEAEPIKAEFFELVADESLLADFISESKEHLDLASNQLLTLESEPDNEEAINSVFRAFHTVKGIAGFLNLEEVQKLAHDTENLLDKVRREELELTPPLIDLVFEAMDWMTRLIGNVRKGLETNGMVNIEPELVGFLQRVHAAAGGQAFTANKPPANRLGDILVKQGAVSKEVLEQTMEETRLHNPDKKLGQVLVEKAIVSEKTISEALQEQNQSRTKGARKQVEIKETLRVDYDRLENMIDTIGELVLAEAMISQDDAILNSKTEGLGKKLYNLRQVSRKLQELGTTIRMVPISGTFQKMARLVRDLSRKSNKPIQFFSQGDETELDRGYVDLIADPLVHMIRNAVDHGVESPQERVKTGKPESGSVKLRAFHEGGNIHVEIIDDGKGLNPQTIFRKAVEKGLVSPDEKMTDQEIYQLIFLPGFSTASAVTEVSGRGVGMDVVRRNINELRGQVQIQSELGVGTTFKMVLPLTLALIDGMLVRVGTERFIFPVLSVLESTRPTPEMVNTIIGKGEIINIRSRQLPLYRLYDLFDIPNACENLTDSLVVIVENNGRQIGVMVDNLVGIQQTVIKNLGHGLFESGGLAGGSIMADGTVGLIVDVAGLINIARTKKKIPSDSAA